ncbi:hypothetical protein GCM10020229_52820 [Kitasatospora albolonga]|uniref:phospholipase D-like domain-containing protein n=1 Tax=Kitasatospora albolonga TaxID=68173 RepID=UPI0031F19126
MRLRRTMTTTAALALGVSLLGAPGTLAGAAVPPANDEVGITATFNTPNGSAAAQNAIRDHLVSLIQRTPAGEEIKGSVFLFTDDVVRNALLDAKARGVKVKLILDEESDNTADGGEFEHLRDGIKDAAGNVVKAGLGSDVFTADSWVMTCPKGRGCVGSRDLDGTGAGHAINHNKFFLFSRVGLTPNVVFQSSANLTTTQRVNYYNNAVTVPDVGLHRNYAEYFEDLKFHGGTTSDGLDHYYRTADSTTGPYKTYFFPRKERTGQPVNDPDTDTVISLISNLDCSDNAGRIRVAMFAFTRDAVAGALVKKQQEGCKVEVLATDEVDAKTGKRTLDTDVREVLKNGHLDRFSACAGTATDAKGAVRPIGIHSKYMLIEGRYLDAPNQKIVFTGSHNYTIPNLRANDETLLKVRNAMVHDAFVANFEAMKADTTTCRV